MTEPKCSKCGSTTKLSMSFQRRKPLCEPCRSKTRVFKKSIIPKLTRKQREWKEMADAKNSSISKKYAEKYSC